MRAVRYLTGRTIDVSPSWRGGEKELRLREARGTNEGLDFFRILFTWCTLDARRHVDARRTRDAKRFRHVASVEATRKHEGHAGIQILEKGPIESLAQSAGTRCVLGRARVKDQSVHDLRVLAGLG